MNSNCSEKDALRTTSTVILSFVAEGNGQWLYPHSADKSDMRCHDLSALFSRSFSSQALLCPPGKWRKTKSSAVRGALHLPYMRPWGRLLPPCRSTPMLAMWRPPEVFPLLLPRLNDGAFITYISSSTHRAFSERLHKSK